MAKILIAVSNVKHNGEFYPYGSELDPKLFTKEQLAALYDNGAVRVEEVPDPPREEVKEPDTTVKKTAK